MLTEATFVGGNKVKISKNGRNAEDEAENSNNYKTRPIEHRNKWWYMRTTNEGEFPPDIYGSVGIAIDTTT